MAKIMMFRGKKKHRRHTSQAGQESTYLSSHHTICAFRNGRTNLKMACRLDVFVEIKIYDRNYCESHSI